MLTLLVLFIAILAIAIIFGVIAGLATVLLPVLIIVGFILIDILALKLLFGRKKKKE